MIYQYRAYKIDKQIAAGTIEAVSEKNAEEALYQAGYKYVLNLKARAPKPALYQIIPSLFGVKTADIVDFSRQLASFLESGSSLHTSLELLREQANKPAMKSVINGLVEQLEQGVSFSQAILEFPRVFPHSFWQVIQSSEKTGELDKGLLQIADYLEKRAIVTDRIRRALAYPIFVIGLGIAVMVMMITTVLPPILRLFESFNTQLPPVTAFAIGTINFFTVYKLQLLLAVFLLIGAVYLYAHLPGGRLSIDHFLLKLPVLGTITSQAALGLFCRTASMLFKAGLPLPNIMDVAIQSTTKNRVILKSLTALKERLMQGEGLAKPMAEDPLFPPMMVRMISVGEQTGTLESSLETLAVYYEEHSNKKIHTLIGMIEPALTLVIGLGIAFVMYSMIIPIYTIMRSMS